VGDDSVGCMDVGKERKACSMCAWDTLERKRLHVKQSIDQALNTLKAHSRSDPHSHTRADAHLQQQQPPPELSSLHLGEYTFCPITANTNSKDNELAPRKPLLPRIYNDLPLPSHSPNDTIVAQTWLEILVESIQESWGSARYAH
jgi:hypothetical protein